MLLRLIAFVIVLLRARKKLSVNVVMSFRWFEMYGESGISGMLIDRCACCKPLPDVLELYDRELLLLRSIVAIRFAIRRFSWREKYWCNFCSFIKFLGRDQFWKILEQFSELKILLFHAAGILRLTITFSLGVRCIEVSVNGSFSVCKNKFSFHILKFIITFCRGTLICKILIQHISLCIFLWTIGERCYQSSNQLTKRFINQSINQSGYPCNRPFNYSAKESESNDILKRSAEFSNVHKRDRSCKATQSNLPYKNVEKYCSIKTIYLNSWKGLWVASEFDLNTNHWRCKSFHQNCHQQIQQNIITNCHQCQKVKCCPFISSRTHSIIHH